MNLNNINLLIKTLEDGTVYGNEVHLRMDRFISGFGNCGTAACLAGHCALLGRKDEYNYSRMWEHHHVGVMEFAMEWLDIPYAIAKPMFLEPGDLKYHEITPAIAVKMLENFRATNKIEWSR